MLYKYQCYTVSATFFLEEELSRIYYWGIMEFEGLVYVLC